jgi:hypothetical protein
MNEMEVAEMIERNIDFYKVDKDRRNPLSASPDTIRCGTSCGDMMARCRQWLRSRRRRSS